MVRGDQWRGKFNRFDVKAFDRIQIMRKNAADRDAFPYLFGANGDRLAQSTIVRKAETARNQRPESLEEIQAKVKAEKAARDARRAEKAAKRAAKLAKAIRKPA